MRESAYFNSIPISFYSIECSEKNVSCPAGPVEENDLYLELFTKDVHGVGEGIVLNVC